MEFETNDSAMSGEMTVTYELTPTLDGTELTVVHEGPPDGVTIADNELGWRMSLDLLAAPAQAIDG